MENHPQSFAKDKNLIVTPQSPARMYKCRVKRAENLFVYFNVPKGEKWKSFAEEKMATRRKSINVCDVELKDFRCRDLPTASTYRMEIRCLVVDQSSRLRFYPNFIF